MPGDDQRLDAILGQLRACGTRLTSSRRIVITELVALLDAGDGHVSAEALATRVQATHPEVHLATVYRTLELLERLGVTVHVHLGHGPSLYHLAERLHHHAVCDRCGRVQEVPTSVVEPVGRWLLEHDGFMLAPHHFALAGLCRDCAGPDAASSTA